MPTDKSENKHLYLDDSLPDSSQIASFKLTENMQRPLMYDTKEYYRPISETAHSHGFLIGSIIAGFIFSLIFLILIVVFLNISA